MNLIANPELLSRLAASYSLGTLRGGARRRFEALAREQAPVRAAALVWQSRFSSLNELQPAASPDAAVWTRIDNLVQADKQRVAMDAARSVVDARAGGWLSNLAFWRAATAVAAFATVAAVVVGVQTTGGVREQMGMQVAQLQAQMSAAPKIEYVAVLADAQTGAQTGASVLVTFDPTKKSLTLKRVGTGFQEASDKSLQLWAMPAAGATGGPRSLGVLSGEPVLRMTAAEDMMRTTPALAISLEPKGGVPGEGGPTGPVVFKGALLQTTL